MQYINIKIKYFKDSLHIHRYNRHKSTLLPKYIVIKNISQAYK